MRMTKTTAVGLALSVAATAMLAGCIDISDPGEPDTQVEYRWERAEGEPTSAERGSVNISEINRAGSISDDGEYDPDDVFIEVRNEYHRPVNMTGWRLKIEGDYEQSFRLPELDEALDPNELFVIAAKEDGAFGEVADLVDSRLKLGKRAVEITMRDADRRLIEPAGSRTEQPFSGGYDLVSVRSMERTQALFDNDGGLDRSWHSNTDDVDGAGQREGISEGWRENTMASPGEANSADYTGSTAGGAFE